MGDHDDGLDRRRTDQEPGPDGPDPHQPDPHQPAPLPFGPSTAATPAGPTAPGPDTPGGATPDPVTGCAAAGDHGDPAALTTYTATPPSAPTDGPAAGAGRSRVALAILSVTAVLAASTFAFIALTRPDGAGSPEEAVQNLFTALAQEDAVGVLESLPPNEREVLVDPLLATVGELQRVGVLDSFALEDVPGADIEVAGLTLASTNLADGLTSVRVTGGTITGTVIPDAVPLGPRLNELIERESGEPVRIEGSTATESLADAGLELVAIEEDGGWHVSLFYTLAEAARGDDPLPAFGQGLTPIGADTPEDAVRQLVQAGIDLDLGRAIQHLPPDEMRVLYDYAPLVVPQADQGAADARAEGYTASLARLDLHAEGDGDVRRVAVDGLDITAGTEDNRVRYTIDGGCTVVESTYRRFQRFVEVGTAIDGPPPVTPSDPGTVAPIEGELSTTRMEICGDGRTSMSVDGEDVTDERGPYGGMRPFPILYEPYYLQAVTAVEHDGRWYVSPVRSVFESVLTSLRGVEGDRLDTFFDSWAPMLGTSSRSTFESVGEPIDGGPSGTYPPGTQVETVNPYTLCSSIQTDAEPGADADEIDAAFDQCLRDHGGEPVDEITELDQPRIVGGTIVALGNERALGYDLGGSPAWEGPACPHGSWASDVAASEPVEVEVLICDAELVAFDTTDGSELWRTEPTEAFTTLRVGADAVVTGGDDGLAVADPRTGVERWTSSRRGVAAVASGPSLVYAGYDDALVAYEATSGKEAWTAPIPVLSLGSDGDALIATGPDGELRRLDPSTGAVRWTSPSSEDAERGDLRVRAFTTGAVIVMDPNRDTSIAAYDLATGDRLWENDDELVGLRMSADGTDVVIIDADRPTITRLDERTGQRLADAPAFPDPPTSLVVRDGLVAAVLPGYGLRDDTLVVAPLR